MTKDMYKELVEFITSSIKEHYRDGFDGSFDCPASYKAPYTGKCSCGADEYNFKILHLVNKIHEEYDTEHNKR